MHEIYDSVHKIKVMMNKDDSRALYRKSLDAELQLSCLPGLEIVLKSAFEAGETDPVHLFDHEGDCTSLRVEAGIEYSLLESSLIDMVQSQDRLHFALLQLAPLLRIEGAQLSGAIQLRDAAHESGASLLRLHARQAGDGDLHDSLPQAFSHDLATQGIALPALHDTAFSYDPRLEAWSFELPLLLLAMSQFARRFWAQILGTTLFLTEISPMSLLGERSRSLALRVRNLKGNRSDAREAIALARGCDTTLVEQGYAAARQLYKNFLGTLKHALQDDARFSAQNKMLAILARLGTPVAIIRRVEWAVSRSITGSRPSTFAPRRS